MHEELLARLPLFQNLAPASRQALDEQIHPLALHRGEVLFHSGDVALGLYVLVSGKVKLTKPSRQPQPSLTTNRKGRPTIPMPRESLLALIGPGEMFGELSVLDGGQRSTTATAMLDCRLYHVPREPMLDLIEKHHDVSQAMLRQMAHRVRVSNETISGLVLSDVPGRMAFLLLTMAERFGITTERGVEVHHDLTQAELAQMVGASRETVNKVLTDFAARKWITMSGKSVVIRDAARLRARID
ncbi:MULTISPECIES: Crp/Fnr family transcriptional regulator [Luteococcus]|uniref:cAMP-binding proteins-catabolite gene activator and regulatory subunit of cAMP-dependent protein kinases n=1 Tax=Luteococcus japonicus LSP_Lj1 TaxID=1255658 RepID=A0A1R4K2J2_9ACTN|nr:MULTISPECIES: Crp/Fnr family transcriptional regulator [Luteococcus]MDN5564008.1 Crp/Fnr family transcriptional regulator [Luteococcus sp.]SJN38479.1 cAMP-binding proteins-catabolite gene activator and regulatory subunit of cAMP-dependent protein kinases [Luteococcus japonicus LSP_Lj1]